MPHRFQFSLRALLVVTGAVCVLFGARHLLQTYGQYVEGFSVKAGETFRIRGQFVRFFGPEKCWYVVCIETRHGITVNEIEKEAERSWLCAYPIDFTARWPFSADKYALTLREIDRHDRLPICGTLVLK